MTTDNKLWLWKNFINGNPEYWAFDNPYPVRLDSDDPLTLGEPCGYAIVKPSRGGRIIIDEQQILHSIKNSQNHYDSEIEHAMRRIIAALDKADIQEIQLSFNNARRILGL